MHISRHKNVLISGLLDLGSIYLGGGHYLRGYLSVVDIITGESAASLKFLEAAWNSHLGILPSFLGMGICLCVAT